jgi:hypothetical protein
MLAGISLLTSLSKKVGAAGLIAGSVDAAIAAASCSLDILLVPFAAKSFVVLLDEYWYEEC